MTGGRDEPELLDALNIHRGTIRCGACGYDLGDRLEDVWVTRYTNGLTIAHSDDTLVHACRRTRLTSHEEDR